ncbi:MAG TPA: hypothetical protein VHK91_15160 [Flavisolibacter sp.]|jgi:hypothetical protein|nr:hypothetical protein [Flavisolibacter sp.]
MNSKKTGNGWLAAALTLPMLLFFLSYWFHHSSHLIPTGFIQPDNVSYLAYGKQYLDAGSPSLFYSNPFNDSNEYAPVYFQPQTLLFAALLKLRVPVVVLLPLFTLLFTFLGFRMLIKLYDRLLPGSAQRIFHLILLGWGGGLLVFTGIPIHLLYNNADIHFLDGVLYLDPASGWWGLNWGRAQFFSCEAYYHFLFLSSIYLILRKRWLQAALTVLITSLSHPFTGIELLVIVGLWISLEWLTKKRTFPVWFALAIALITAFHLYFYLVYLNHFPEHRSVADQYSLPWKLRYFNMLPAYCLVGSLALGSFFMQNFRLRFSGPSVRLLICWFTGAFLLANHELFLPVSMQPIHFTRGYVWTSLFLLGLPMLNQVTAFVKSRFYGAGLIVLGFVFCSDNIAWLANFIGSRADLPSTGHITKEQKQVMNYLDKTSNTGTLLIMDDRDLAYLSTIYTKAYPLVSHPFTTPFVQQKEKEWNAVMNQGVMQQKWLGRPVTILLRMPIKWPGIPALLSHYNFKIQEETPGYWLIRTDTLKSQP